MPRPQLPPSDDPKVQARRDKARENAQKKRDGDKVEKQKASSTIAGVIKRKLASDSKAKATAGSTLAGAIKRKLAVKPAKKEDTNRLHNLPEEIQKEIMRMAKPKWKRMSYTMSPDNNFNDRIYCLLMTGIKKGETGYTAGKHNMYNTTDDGINNSYIITYIKEQSPEFILNKTIKVENVNTIYNLKIPVWLRNTTIYFEYIDFKDATLQLQQKLLKKKERILKRFEEDNNSDMKPKTIEKIIKKWNETSLMFAIRLIKKDGTNYDNIELLYNVSKENTQDIGYFEAWVDFDFDRKANPYDTMKILTNNFGKS